MKLKEIKNWINSLPEDFLEYDSVACEFGELKESDNTYRLDKPFVSLDVDEKSKEILFITKE